MRIPLVFTAVSYDNEGTMNENKQEIEEPKGNSRTLRSVGIFVLVIILSSVAIGVAIWLVLRAPITHGTPGERLQATGRKLEGYDQNANANELVVSLMQPYGRTIKTTPYAFSAVTLPGYTFKVPVNETGGAVRAIVNNIANEEVDTITKKIEADLKERGFHYEEHDVGNSYYMSKDFVCDVIGLDDDSGLRVSKDDPDVTVPFVQVACVSIADYIKSAEFYRPLYNAIVEDTSYQLYEITMLNRKPIESSEKGYWRLEAASIQFADTDLTSKYGVNNRMWFYKTPNDDVWRLLEGSASYTPDCGAIEKNDEARKAFKGAECRDTSQPVRDFKSAVRHVQ